MATCYRGSPISYTELPLFPELSSEEKQIRPPYKAVITEVDDYNGDGAADLSDVEWLLQNRKNSCEILKGDGDFRSDECVEQGRKNNSGKLPDALRRMQPTEK